MEDAAAGALLRSGCSPAFGALRLAALAQEPGVWGARSRTGSVGRSLRNRGQKRAATPEGDGP
jgi:hypothetical protein